VFENRLASDEMFYIPTLYTVIVLYDDGTSTDIHILKHMLIRLMLFSK